MKKILQNDLVIKSFILGSCAVIILTAASCFFDIDVEAKSDIHDNLIEIDVCEDIKERVQDAGVEPDVSCEEGSETCEPKESGSSCDDNSECSSNLCICNICISLTDFF